MGITEQIIYLAKEEGIKDGLKKGRKTSMEQVSKNLLKEGLDIEFINKITSVSIAKLKKLRDELHLKAS